MSRQDNSDPLPYVQVDRAVAPAAALLASHMKVSSQHALGSLVGFWNLCGEPRELERIVEATPPGKEPEVVLTAEDVALRFHLASDCKVEPVVLARLGILEQRGESFRVRGMSRFFKPITDRLVKRKVGAMGGKASADARKAAAGSAQPVSVGSGPASDSASAVVQQSSSSAEAAPKQRRSTEQHSGQRSAVSGQLLKAAAGKPLTTAEGWWAWAQDRRDMVAGLVRETPPNPRDLSTWFSTAMGEVGGDEQRLCAGYELFLVDPYWRNDADRKCNWRGWVNQWRDFVPSTAPPVASAKARTAVAQPSVWSTQPSTTVSETF